MNIVLYTRDFEPITVLDLPLWLIEQLERQGGVRVAVQEQAQWMAADAAPTEPTLKTVTLRCVKLNWLNNEKKTIIITDDDELALRLKPDWLSGQRSQINNYKQTIDNLVKMLKKAMRPNE